LNRQPSRLSIFLGTGLCPLCNCSIVRGRTQQCTNGNHKYRKLSVSLASGHAWVGDL
jgi:hypothetical protein